MVVVSKLNCKLFVLFQIRNVQNKISNSEENWNFVTIHVSVFSCLSPFLCQCPDYLYEEVVYSNQ